MKKIRRNLWNAGILIVCTIARFGSHPSTRAPLTRIARNAALLMRGMQISNAANKVESWSYSF